MAISSSTLISRPRRSSAMRVVSSSTTPSPSSSKSSESLDAKPVAKSLILDGFAFSESAPLFPSSSLTSFSFASSSTSASSSSSAGIYIALSSSTDISFSRCNMAISSSTLISRPNRSSAISVVSSSTTTSPSSSKSSESLDAKPVARSLILEGFAFTLSESAPILSSSLTSSCTSTSSLSTFVPLPIIPVPAPAPSDKYMALNSSTDISASFCSNRISSSGFISGFIPNSTSNVDSSSMPSLGSESAMSNSSDPLDVMD